MNVVPNLAQKPSVAIDDALRVAAEGIDDLGEYSAANAVAELSSNTVFTGIDVFEDAIVKLDKGWEAPATIYVELNYGGKRDGVVMGDSFPGTVHFEFDGSVAVISDITVDTSSFFGPGA